MNKILDLINDGLNMDMDDEFIYFRCKKEIIKYSIAENNIQIRKIIFNKDGKARYITISKNYICVLDFCDLYILNKTDLSIIKYLKIGNDASTDLIATKCDDINVYISIRNGKMGVYNIENDIYNQYDICNESSWEFILYDDKIYIGTVYGTIYEIDKNNMRVLRKIKISNKNIYGVIVNENNLYTISQDKSIKVINLNTFEVINSVNNAIKGMCRILGIYNDNIIIADQGVSIWDKTKLTKNTKLEISTGHFNKGACLYNNILIGSDYMSIYKILL